MDRVNQYVPLCQCQCHCGRRPAVVLLRGGDAKKDQEQIMTSPFCTRPSLWPHLSSTERSSVEYVVYYYIFSVCLFVCLSVLYGPVLSDSN